MNFINNMKVLFCSKEFAGFFKMLEFLLTTYNLWNLHYLKSMFKQLWGLSNCPEALEDFSILDGVIYGFILNCLSPPEWQNNKPFKIQGGIFFLQCVCVCAKHFYWFIIYRHVYLALDACQAAGASLWVTEESAVTATVLTGDSYGPQLMLLLHINLLDPGCTKQGPALLGGQWLEEEVFIHFCVV